MAIAIEQAKGGTHLKSDSKLSALTRKIDAISRPRVGLMNRRVLSQTLIGWKKLVTTSEENRFRPVLLFQFLPYKAVPGILHFVFGICDLES